MSVPDGDTAERGFAPPLRGVMLPFPTPFDEGGEFDVAALRHNLERWNETGVTGYVALGSTGERVHLEDEECVRVVEAARASIPASLSLIVGIGQQSTRGTIAEARRAAALGANFVLTITPNFYRGALTQEALTEHYERVADASPLPVLVYSIPQNTGITLTPETVGRLSRHENISGIKESSGDVIAFTEMLRAATEDFQMLTGHGAAVFATLAAGGSGAILAVACCVPRFCVALARAVEAGDYERARSMQRQLAPLARAVTTRFGIGGLKCALDLAGYRGGRVRAPLSMPAADARREIALLLAECEAEEDFSATGSGATASGGAAR